MSNEIKKLFGQIGKTIAHRPDYIDREPPVQENLPAGPFAQDNQGPRCSLLIFVPRNVKSTIIDITTGGYGYSHLAVDCGELDVPSGKRVMIESTVGVGVHYGFQDEYGDRNFVRIPLERLGFDVTLFCNCVRAKLGEKFDDEEALTLGLLHDPAKQICSDLAIACLPELIRANIAYCHQAGSLPARSAVREYRDPTNTLRLFVSPNGFAEYFGAPRGGMLTRPDQEFEPILRA